MLGWEGHDCEKGKKKKGEIIRFISKRLNIFFFTLIKVMQLLAWINEKSFGY